MRSRMFFLHNVRQAHSKGPRRKTGTAISLLTCILFAGCNSPSASKRIQLQSSTQADAVVSCAERIVTELAGKDERWDARVTRRNADAGLLETGNFDAENKSGFRVRVRFDDGSKSAAVELKGAGAYFVDLGVDEAISTFTASLEQCLASG